MSSTQQQQSGSGGGNRLTNIVTTGSSPQQPNPDQQQQQSANQKDFQFPGQQHFHPHAHATRSHAQPQQAVYQHPTGSMTPPVYSSVAAPTPQHSSQLPTSPFNSTPQHHQSTDYDTSQLASNADDQNEEEGIREQDRLLPIANVARIMKQAVPPSAKISKDAKDTVTDIILTPYSLV